MLELFFALLVVGIVFASARAHKQEVALLDGWRKEGLQEFMSLKVSSSSERFAFDGATATILKTEVVCPRANDGLYRSNFTVVFFAKNSAGEYFMFRKTGEGKPFFKHVEKNMAVKVLRLEEPCE